MSSSSISPNRPTTLVSRPRVGDPHRRTRSTGTPNATPVRCPAPRTDLVSSIARLEQTQDELLDRLERRARLTATEEHRLTRVMIAEDEAIIRLDLKETLEEEGYEVVGRDRPGRRGRRAGHVPLQPRPGHPRHQDAGHGRPGGGPGHQRRAGRRRAHPHRLQPARPDRAGPRRRRPRLPGQAVPEVAELDPGRRGRPGPEFKPR